MTFGIDHAALTHIGGRISGKQNSPLANSRKQADGEYFNEERFERLQRLESAREPDEGRVAWLENLQKAPE
jgi:hypothetical protein